MQIPKIHQVTSNDYAELINVWESSVRATHHFLSESDIERYRPLILEQYFDQLNLFCIREHNDIVGFIGVDGTLIQMLFVHPNGRGRGIGKILVNYVIANFAVNKVDVNEQNEQAVGFYKHVGFEFAGRQEYDADGKPFPILHMTLLPKIELRTAEIPDIDQISQLYTATVLTVCTGEYDPDQLKIWAAMGQNTERWQKRIESQYFLLAELSHKIVGFASLTPEGYLDVFYIHKDHQRKGIAFMLYEALEKHALELSLRTIIADVSKTAKPFFEKQGFTTIREQRNYIQEQMLINYKMEKII